MDIIKLKKGPKANRPVILPSELTCDNDIGNERLIYGGQTGAVEFPNMKDINDIKTQLVETTNYASGRDRDIFGTEYMSHIHKLIMNIYPFSILDSTKLKTICSGDSTTAGDSTTQGYKLNELIKEYALKDGFIMDSINAGHSGQSSKEWSETYVDKDIAQNPDIYVVRWGINDGAMRTGTLDEKAHKFESYMKTGLQKVRTALPLDKCTVVLMTPNSTFDIPNGRGPEWYEKINAVIRGLAREFKCVFIDTYKLWYDSQSGYDYMDNPYGDGRHIHPNNVMNIWITSKLYEILFPKGLISKFGIANIYNIPSNVQFADVNILPFDYPYGISMYRCDDKKGFPFNGGIITYRSADNVIVQYNIPWLDNNPRIAFRTRYSQHGVSTDNIWSQWSFIGSVTENWTYVTLQNNWQHWDNGTDGIHEPCSYRKICDGANWYVEIIGLIKNGVTTLGTTLFTLPPGYRPSRNAYKVTACSTGVAVLEIWNTGEVKIVSCPSNTWLTLSGIKFSVLI